MRNFRQYGEKDGFNKDASVKIGGEKLQPLPKRAAIRCLKHSLRDVKNLTRGISMQHFSNLSGYISWERAQDEFILQPRSYSSLFKPDAAAVQIEEPQHGELGHKPETILIVVSDGFKGFGDFLFALKLSEQLKKKYADSGLAKPLIFIVSQPSGKDKIIALQGDIEFSVEVLTLEDLKVKVESKEIRVDTIIEGPVFKQNLIFQIDDIFAKVEKPIPLFMLPEYGFKGDAGMITDHREYLKIYCENITYMGTVCSGFNQEDAENGILLSEQLFHPQPSFEWLQQLDPAIQRALLVDVDYVANTELTLQYSHDENLGTTQTAAEHFLKVHIEFSKTSDKKQDVVMVGLNEAAKRTALLAIKDDLRGYGFTHISFFNVKTQSLEVIYDAKTAGKTYRVIYAPGMSHMSMMACIALSGPLCGATGDQSLAEALSANKVVVYEPLSHKKRFIDDYDARMRTIARSYGNSDVEELLRLLREAAYFWDYEELGNKLRTSGIIEEFQRTNARLIKGSNLANAVFDCLGCEQPLEELYDGTFIKIITTIMTLMKIEDSPRPQVGKLVEMPKDFLFSEALARRILEGKELVTHPTILSSSKGIYHLNLDPIGIGGWGNVYAAKQYALVDGQVQVTEPLAIKDMKGNRMSQLWKECAVFEKAHPGEHFEVFEQDHRSYLAMPLYKGISLWEYLLSHPHSSLLPEQRYHMANELFIGLEQMHAKGITHNDLKTKNILYDDSGKKIHIIDFGCALDLQSSHPTMMRFQNLDKAVFAFEFPPEYLAGALAHPSQDIYTMTPILAEILGVNRKELVRSRLCKTFEKIEDPLLFNEIRQAFDSSDSLEEALLLKLNHRIHEPEFAVFVTAYVDTPYDFSLSQVQLGKDMFDLLNAMQSKEPENRPSAQECLEQLRQVMPEITGAEIDQSDQGPAVPGM